MSQAIILFTAIGIGIAIGAAVFLGTAAPPSEWTATQAARCWKGLADDRQTPRVHHREHGHGRRTCGGTRQRRKLCGLVTQKMRTGFSLDYRAYSSQGGAIKTANFAFACDRAGKIGAIIIPFESTYDNQKQSVSVYIERAHTIRPPALISLSSGAMDISTFF